MHNLTPSELVILYGDQFAKEAGMLTAREDVLTSGKKVGNSDLAIAAIRAAFLAAERAGQLRVEQIQKKALFGLIKSKATQAAPTPGAAGSWPAGTLEARIEGVVARGAAEVQTIVYNLLDRDQSDAAKSLLDLARAALAARDVLDVEVVTHLKVFKTQKFTLPPESAAKLDASKVSDVKAMLDDAERTQPELQKPLTKAITTGIAKRTEQSESHSSD